MIGMLLESAGHSVSSAANGPAALQMYEREHPDIVLLDISLPGMTGQEVCARIRAANAPPLKPIDPNRLVALIEDIGR
jgi:CheY-like chemotaxis protein